MLRDGDGGGTDSCHGRISAGTTTLGVALARRLGLHHLDTDDLYWMPTDPPYTTPRAVQERLALFRSRRRQDRAGFFPVRR